MDNFTLEILCLEFDKNGFMQYWIDQNDLVWGYSLWKSESKNSSGLVTKIPTKFKKHFKNVELSERYKKVIIL